MLRNVRHGGAVGKALDGATERIRRQLETHVASMRELDEQVSRLIARRGEALVDLSKHYLPKINLATIEGVFREIQDDLMEVLARKQRRQRQTRDEITAGRREVEGLEAQLKEVTERLDEKVAQRERLEDMLAERLHASEDFAALSKQALEAEVELEKNEQRVAEINQEAAEKLPSYERSRLFKYLIDRGYGTPKYQKEGLTKRLDEWVAKMIDFHGARRSYHFLSVTPKLMAQEVERRRDQFNDLMEQVEAIEDHIADEIGLTDVMREGQELGANRDGLVADVAKRQDKLLALEEELLRLEGTQNEFYEQSVARMKNFLSNMEERRLKQRSLATPEPDDDAIVAEVIWLNDQLDDAKRRGGALGQQRVRWDDQLTGMQQVQQRFREAEFDSRRSLFDSRFDVGEYVERYLEGRIGAEGLWNAIEQHQEFAPARHEQHGGRHEGNSGWGDVFNSEMSYVLLGVLADVAGQAMRNAAYRGMQRRSPTRSKQRRSSGRPKLPRRGFTKGRGF